MAILWFYAVLLFLTGARSLAWSLGHLDRKEWAPFWTFLLLAMAWFSGAGALAGVAVS
jgi:hypothetical protein